MTPIAYRSADALAMDDGRPAPGKPSGSTSAPAPDTAPDFPPPKFAVVVAGDPDETLRNTAAFIETEAARSGLRAPTDPTLRAALRGEPSTEEDGLEGLRSIRRGLGVDPAKDLTAYQRIGLIAGADALVVIRREGGIVIEVFDVSAAQFYEGTLTFAQSTSEQRARFIESRAQQAQLRWTKPKPPSTAPAPTAQKPETGPPADKKEESRAKRRWKKAWPYVVAGALLAGGVTYLIIDRRNTDEVGPPLLRFRPGEE
ncbi:MAG: hypothetical protein AMJ62_15510 [Myxococcales bacterium SG8_38]|nr:MAG: hypothetical protein AMJ62_15510 [Myxococcales bacterium SG8_38]